ncbi:MAG: T9SS type A sorting domain-containing protein, partial [Flavobacteriaceae bacterium]
VTGRKVMDTAINGNTLDVSSFNSGFYMLKVTINGQSKISKLVVR